MLEISFPAAPRADRRWLRASAAAALLPAALVSAAAQAQTAPADQQPKQQATELSEIAVTSDAAAQPVQPDELGRLDRRRIELNHQRTPDVADILRGIAGVSTYNAGGFSSLPAIRGLDNERVNVLVDGVAIAMACPNNMNPALSYVDPTMVQSLTVVSGASPVSFGGESLGGTISAETAPPRFAAAGEHLASGAAGASYRSNGGGVNGNLSFQAANEDWALGYAGSYVRSNNYKGGGDKGIVRSSLYAKTDHGISLARRVGPGFVEVKAGYQYAPYEGFPNQYMDMDENRSWYANARWKGLFDWGDADVVLHYRDVYHDMDVLADKKGHMPMTTLNRTGGYTAKLSRMLPTGTLRAGSEYVHQWVDDYWPAVSATHMSMGPNTYININKGTRDRLGHYLEWENSWSPVFKTILGVRNDQVWMNTGNVQPYGNHPMQQGDIDAAKTFNAIGHRRHDSNWSWSANAEWLAAEGVKLELGYARKVRSPNMYERYAWGARSMSSRMIGWYGDGNGYVGNIDLKPEKADTVSGKLTFSGGAGEGKAPWSISISPYWMHVSDFIDAVPVMPLMGGFTMLKFANQEARFYGVDLSADLPLWANTKAGTARLGLVGSYARGDNLTGDHPLYHQMPLNAKAHIIHVLGDWDNHFELEAVAKKDRVDPIRKEPVSDAYMLVNIGTGYQFGPVRLGVDVTNLFDKAYDLPLGGMSLGDYRWSGMAIRRPVPGRGRSINVGVSAKF